MSVATYLNWFEQVTVPNHPFYHPVQVTFFAGISYVGTICLTSLSPAHGASLAILAYAISQLVTPLFVECFEPYQDISLAPLIGQALQMSFSLVIAKVICSLVGHTLSFKEIRQVGLVFLISLYVSRLVLLKLRQRLE